MPALPDVPNVLKVVFNWTIGEDIEAINRVHIGYTGTAPDNSTCNALAAELYVIWQDEFLVYSHASNSLTGCEVVDLTTPSSGAGSHAAANAGGLSGGLLGADVAFVASGKIGRRYRGGKPRIYLPCGDASYLQDAQTWTDAFVALMQASCDAVRSDINGYTSSGCVLTALEGVSYYSGFTIRPTPPIAGVRAKNIPTPRATAVVDPFTNLVAEQRLGSQRRRLLRSP